LELKVTELQRELEELRSYKDRFNELQNQSNKEIQKLKQQNTQEIQNLKSEIDKERKKNEKLTETNRTLTVKLEEANAQLRLLQEQLEQQEQNSEFDSKFEEERKLYEAQIVQIKEKYVSSSHSLHSLLFDLSSLTTYMNGKRFISLFSKETALIIRYLFIPFLFLLCAFFFQDETRLGTLFSTTRR
jgi:DNA repair exonuclease SbcCD ATPase subunit